MPPKNKAPTFWVSGFTLYLKPKFYLISSSLIYTFIDS